MYIPVFVLYLLQVTKKKLKTEKSKFNNKNKITRKQGSKKTIARSHYVRK